MTSTSPPPSGQLTPGQCPATGSACVLLHLELPASRPVWAALDAAAQRRFTGQLTLHLHPVVRVWFHDGVAYHAERDGDPSLEDQLVDRGVVSWRQLTDGVVLVAGVRHLGRLFERVPSLDRDRVEVAQELATAALLGEIAGQIVDAVGVEPYVHHPSGIAGWLLHREQPVARPLPRIEAERPAPLFDIDAYAASEEADDDEPEPVVGTVPAPEPLPVQVAVPVAFVAPEPTVVVEPEPEPVAVDVPPPASEPYPRYDLAEVVAKVAAEDDLALLIARSDLADLIDVPELAELPAAEADDDAADDVPDSVKEAVRMALAEIAEAARPVTQQWSVDAIANARSQRDIPTSVVPVVPAETEYLDAVPTPWLPDRNPEVVPVAGPRPSLTPERPPARPDDAENANGLRRLIGGFRSNR